MSGRAVALEAELAGLRKALHNRASIEQAIGVLTVLRRCSPEEAFPLLVRLSQAYNVKLYRIARLLVQLAATTPPDTLEAALVEALRGGAVTEASSDPDEPDEVPLLDDGLVEAAREVVAAAADGGDAEQAVRQLYRLLVDRGWLAPHTVLSWL